MRLSFTTLAEVVERLALPPDGVDLRAELDALQSARVSQALEQTGGDMSAAARLLRMTRLDLLRLESRLAEREPRTGRRPRFEPASFHESDIPRMQNGVEVVSRAVIQRLDVEGLTERQIASRLGVNDYLVEKVLREQTEQRVRELDAEGVSMADIASRSRLPLARVRRILAATATRIERPRPRPRKPHRARGAA